MSNRKAAAVVLVCVAVVGLVLGLWPRTTLSELGNDHGCGSAFVPDTQAVKVDDLAAQFRGDSSNLVAGCDASLSSARTFALVLLGVAGVGLLGLALTRSPAKSEVSS